MKKQINQQNKNKLFLIIFIICTLIFVMAPLKAKQNNKLAIDFQVFPVDNSWNTDISKNKIHANSDSFVATIGKEEPLHPDFGTVWEGAPIGIPYIIVTKEQPLVAIILKPWDERDSEAYISESDVGPYPIPDDAPVEGGFNSTQDRHVLVVDKDNLILYELYHAVKVKNGWQAISSAKFDLKSNKLRPKGWTSADAAGLPIFPGLVKYEEILKGEINHAIRVTVPETQIGYISPARHYASSSTNANYPPMGLRLRLKANFDISKFSATNKIILRALKKYGMIVADNGAPWFITGSPDSRWNDDDLHNLTKVKGKNFEAVYTGEIEK